MDAVELTHLSKQYQGGTHAVRDVSLTVEAGEFFTLLGPSGCGKTTTLRMIAGLENPTGGRIRIGGRDCTLVHPRERGVGLVFQSYALYPHMTVFDNIALNLKVQGVATGEIRARVQEIVAALRLEPLLKRRPKQLSGGERQRVALGRALVRNPKVLLMDEPLSNLDLKLREHMRTELRRLHDTYKHTVICVTHDQAEAMTMSDRIAVMRDGVVEQVGSPEEVYSQPVNTFVASFLGTPSINLVPGQVAGSAAADGLLPLRLGPAGGDSGGRPALVGIRPEDVLLTATGEPGTISARIRFVEPTGASKLLFIDIWPTADGATRLVVMVPGHQPHRAEDSIAIGFRRGGLMVFDPESQALLGFG